MTSYMMKTLKNIVSCNTPVGLFMYDFPKCCIVHKTLGDRRLGTHILAGLDLLLPLVKATQDCYPIPDKRPNISTSEIIVD